MMGKAFRMPAWLLARAFLLLLLVPAAPAAAYVDPGTTNVVFSGLGYLLGVAGVAFCFLFRPLVRLWKKVSAALFKKNRQDHVDET